MKDLCRKADVRDHDLVRLARNSCLKSNAKSLSEASDDRKCTGQIDDRHDLRDSDARIFVLARKRPIFQDEIFRGQFDCVSVVKEKEIVVHKVRSTIKSEYLVENHSFQFDRAYKEEDSSARMYSECIQKFAQQSLWGKYVTFFAYGETGSGKTHTMNEIMSFFLHDLGQLVVPSNGFEYGTQRTGIDRFLSASEAQHVCFCVSYFEVYQNQVFDLLNSGKQLKVLEDKNGAIQIPGLIEYSTRDVDSIHQYIQHGIQERAMGRSHANPNSSRSHAILQLSLRFCAPTATGVDQECSCNASTRWKLEHGETMSRFLFVDLAGLEFAKTADPQSKLEQIEASEINKSLLALKECIRAMRRNQKQQLTKTTSRRPQFVPFRQSTLTHLLQDVFLNPFSHLVMLSHIRPGNEAIEATLNTLQYSDLLQSLDNHPGTYRIVRKSKSELLDSQFSPSNPHLLESNANNASGLSRTHTNVPHFLPLPVPYKNSSNVDSDLIQIRFPENSARTFIGLLQDPQQKQLFPGTQASFSAWKGGGRNLAVTDPWIGIQPLNASKPSELVQSRHPSYTIRSTLLHPTLENNPLRSSLRPAAAKALIKVKETKKLPRGSINQGNIDEINAKSIGYRYYSEGSGMTASKNKCQAVGSLLSAQWGHGNDEDGYAVPSEAPFEPLRSRYDAGTRVKQYLKIATRSGNCKSTVHCKKAQSNVAFTRFVDYHNPSTLVFSSHGTTVSNASPRRLEANVVSVDEKVSFDRPASCLGEPSTSPQQLVHRGVRMARESVLSSGSVGLKIENIFVDASVIPSFRTKEFKRAVTAPAGLSPMLSEVDPIGNSVRSSEDAIFDIKGGNNISSSSSIATMKVTKAACFSSNPADKPHIEFRKALTPLNRANATTATPMHLKRGTNVIVKKAVDSTPENKFSAVKLTSSSCVSQIEPHIESDSRFDNVRKARDPDLSNNIPFLHPFLQQLHSNK